MDLEVSAQIANQIALQMEGIKALIWFFGIVNTMLLALGTLYGYWLWDLNRKVGVAVTGAECEARNNSQFANTGDLRLEIKDDSETLTKRFTEGLARSDRERDTALASLQKQIEAFMTNSESQHQNNFETVVDVLREIGCKK
jgi:hypothetical protein